MGTCYDAFDKQLFSIDALRCPAHGRNLRGVPVSPLFGLGYRTPTFQDEKVKNLLLSAVNRGVLRRLNYKKTFSAGVLSQTPQRELMSDALPDLRVGWEGIPPHHSPLLLSWDPRAAHCSPSELVPPLFRPKLRPCPAVRNLLSTTMSVSFLRPVIMFKRLCVCPPVWPVSAISFVSIRTKSFELRYRRKVPTCADTATAEIGPRQFDGVRAAI